MRERRVHPRYDVSEYPEIKAHTVKGPIGEKLMTLSIGGAGFWAPAEDFNFKINQRVNIEFRVEGVDHESIQIKGEILYIVPHPFEAQIGRFYGVRFSHEAHQLVKESIETLHALCEKGQIQMA